MNTQLNQINKSEVLGQALGRIASGVYIVTIKENNEDQGLLATWICQGAFSPPTIVLAVNKERPILPLLQPGKTFTVNVISKKNMDIFKAFAKPAQSASERFSGLKLLDGRSPAAVVFSEAVAYLDCKVSTSMDAGDHTIIGAEVTGGALLNGEDEPMIHLRKNGFQY